MARKRLSWDKEKKAEKEKKADPYTMNQDHPNPPASKYDIGGPSEFAEDPDMKTPWKSEGRVETGHPAPIREAVKAARQLEDRALKCITIAQRILPGASDSAIEDQAADFMYLPEKSILATLQRQAELAEVLAKDNGEDEEVLEEKEKEEKEKEAAKKEEEVPEEEEKEAAKKEKEVPEEEEKEAAKKVEVPEEEEKEAAKKEKEVPEEEEKEAAKKVEVPEEKEKEATTEMDIELSSNSVDLLDSVFAAEEKTGAKKLSGIVKQASIGNKLENLWSAPPDVSKAFNIR